MNSRYYLPNDTAKLLTEARLKTCKNLGLVLDKYAPQRVIEESKEKGSWLKTIETGSYIDARLAENVYQRWLNATKGAQHFSATTDWRMVVGLGGETVLETDLTLHHLYGIPFIPGSALKGLARAYVTSEIYPSKNIDDDNEIVKHIFGSQEHAGTVIFFDAMPVKGQVNFEVDIMNPHYPDYYGKGEQPTNDQNPNPITFLTVAKTAFMFALAPRSPKDQDDVKQAKDWLQQALQKYGVGGKTSAGYGYFKTQAAYTRPNIPQFKQGDTIRGMVIDEKTDPIGAKYIQSGKASKCLQYLPFPTNQVLILIDAKYEEAKQWKTKNFAVCQFIEEQVEDSRILLICQPKKKGQ